MHVSQKKLMMYFIDCRLRSRVNSVYRRKFLTVNKAEIHYGLTLSDSLAELVIHKKRGKSRRPKNFVEMSEASPSPHASTAATSTTTTSTATSAATSAATSTASTASSNGQPLITVENLFRLASLLDSKDLEMLTNKLFL